MEWYCVCKDASLMLIIMEWTMMWWLLYGECHLLIQLITLVLQPCTIPLKSFPPNSPEIWTKIEPVWEYDTEIVSVAIYKEIHPFNENYYYFLSSRIMLPLCTTIHVGSRDHPWAWRTPQSPPTLSPVILYKISEKSSQIEARV